MTMKGKRYAVLTPRVFKDVCKVMECSMIAATAGCHARKQSDQGTERKRYTAKASTIEIKAEQKKEKKKQVCALAW